MPDFIEIYRRAIAKHVLEEGGLHAGQPTSLVGHTTQQFRQSEILSLPADTDEEVIVQNATGDFYFMAEYDPVDGGNAVS